MSETIVNGYLINKLNYQVFDEIITFITPTNERISCLSLGSRKIESKNGRNLFLGNFNEFQIFQSRSDNKLSKLKKTVVIKPIHYELQPNPSFILLHECINSAPPNTNNLFTFYEDMLNLLSQNKYQSEELTLIILTKYCKVLGLVLEVNQCVFCGSKKLKTISFAKHGMLCPICFAKERNQLFNLDISKTIYFLFNEGFDKIKPYSQS
jgi:DNA repair protein RecO (recombination protein O)